MDKDIKPVSVLFVCIGNTCRGPMAENMARARWPHYQFESAGLREPNPGEEVSPHVEGALQRVGIAMTEHKPQSIRSLELSRYSHIVAMAPDIARALKKDLQVSADVILNVEDPYSDELVRYVKCRQQIEKEFAKLADKLSAGSVCAEPKSQQPLGRPQA